MISELELKRWDISENKNEDLYNGSAPDGLYEWCFQGNHLFFTGTVDNRLYELDLEKGVFISNGAFGGQDSGFMTENISGSYVIGFQYPDAGHIRIRVEDIKGNVVSDKLYDDKPKKKKRKNLFEKCVDAINEYTDDLELEDLLVTYLKMRLEVKEKPLYYNMWRGLLNKLFSLSKNLSDLCNIVQQSIDKGWLSFYELKTFNGKKKDLQVISSEFGSVTCNKADDEEMTDAYF